MSSTALSVRSTGELRERARREPRAVRSLDFAPDRTRRHGEVADHGRGSVRGPCRGRSRRRGRDRRGQVRVRDLAHGPGAGSGCAGQAVRRAAGRAQGRHRRADHDRGGEDPVGGPRRGSGDDRHLRLRGRPLAPARGTDDAVRATRPPADGDLAPARRRGRDLGLQLPGRRVVVEHRHRARVRGQRRLEALTDDAADVDGVRGGARPRDRGMRGAGRASPAGDRRCRGGTGPGRQPRRRARERHRIGADGRTGGAPRGGPPRPLPARARRQQCRGRRAVRRSRASDPRNRVRRGGDRRPALHDAAPRDRARGRRRRARRGSARRVRPPSDRRPVR